MMDNLAVESREASNKDYSFVLKHANVGTLV